MKDKVSRRVILHGTLKNGLYQLEFPSIQRSSSKVSTSHLAAVVSESSNNKLVQSSPVAFQAESSKSCSVSKFVWHQRLGHVADRVVNSIVKSCNFPVSMNEKSIFCDSCQLGKSHRLPFSRSVSCSSQPLALVHCDLWGSSPVPSTLGYRFYISFVDDFTRLTHIYPLKLKSDVLSACCQYKALVENQFEKRIKTLQTDWGGG